LVSLHKTRDLLIREVAPGKVNAGGGSRPGGMAVKVTTDPPGAELTVEGDPPQRCPSPCVLSLAPDSSLRASLEGFRTELRRAEAAWREKGAHIALIQEFGFVHLTGPQGEAAVLLDGAPVSKEVPARLQVPAGRYQVRTVREGKVVGTREVEVKPLGTVQFAVEQ